jgi:hypothetical protein
MGDRSTKEESTKTVIYQNILYLQKHLNLPAKYTSVWENEDRVEVYWPDDFLKGKSLDFYDTTERT